MVILFLQAYISYVHHGHTKRSTSRPPITARSQQRAAPSVCGSLAWHAWLIFISIGSRHSIQLRLSDSECNDLSQLRGHRRTFYACRAEKPPSGTEFEPRLANNRRQISHFLTPVKIRGVIGEMFERDFSATPNH